MNIKEVSDRAIHDTIKNIPYTPPIIQQRPTMVIPERFGFKINQISPNVNTKRGITERTIFFSDPDKLLPKLRKAPVFSTLVMVR